MAAPKTKNWSAHENAHKPTGFHLLVNGEVEVSALNMLPQLTKRTSRDPKVLELELTIAANPDEPGGAAVVWRCADYHEVVTPDQYGAVVIMWDDNVIARVNVVDDREHGAAMKKQSDTQNAAAAKTIKLKPAKPAKPAPKKSAPAKKAAPKKAAPKKKAPKAVGGWAKKAKKKTAKKAARKSAKKSARKPAKKSALKRFVKKLVKKLTPKKKKKR